MFPLDDCTDFWESRCCDTDEIPSFALDSTAPASGAFLFLGSDFLTERLRRGANQFARGASVRPIFAVFKVCRAGPCGFAARCRSSRCRKIFSVSGARFLHQPRLVLGIVRPDFAAAVRSRRWFAGVGLGG